MKSTALSAVRRWMRQTLRKGLARLPRETRFALHRRLVRCDPDPGERLVVKIAETADELEACFALLHDAYVASGFMRPDPSGLRVTVWHALPTTTTICAKVDGEVVGTLSMVREGVFGLPLQSAFDLSSVRAKPGQLAEISALAIRRDFRSTGGTILFPLMKFMYEYCTQYFDTRHLLIAVNPNMIELYESLLLFQRLPAHTIEHYDFANGAPAVGATLDLLAAPAQFERLYRGSAERRDLHRYFTRTRLPQLQMPPRRYFTTNDPVMTPALLDRFFNERTRVFATLDARQRRLLHSIYDSPGYHAVLPPVGPGLTAGPQERQLRYSIRCPGWIALDGQRRPLNLLQISVSGALVDLGVQDLPLQVEGELTVWLGQGLASRVTARAVRRTASGYWGLAIAGPDDAWRECVATLERSRTYRELAPASVAGAEPAAAPAAPAVSASAAGVDPASAAA
jgi:hypothetical protein